eukprot:UN04125
MVDIDLNKESFIKPPIDPVDEDETVMRCRSTFWEPGALRKGYFEKRGGIMKGFRKRFFVLALSRDIYYFTNEDYR